MWIVQRILSLYKNLKIFKNVCSSTDTAGYPFFFLFFLRTSIYLNVEAGKTNWRVTIRHFRKNRKYTRIWHVPRWFGYFDWFECTKIKNCRVGTRGKRGASFVLYVKSLSSIWSSRYFHLALYGISTRACMYNICTAYTLDRDSKLVLGQRKMQVVLLTSHAIGMVHCDVVRAKLS